MKYRIKMVLFDWPYRLEDKKLLIEFFGVRDVKIGQLDKLYWLRINIVDVSKDQLEGIHFKITEEEYHSFAFFCDYIKFEELSET